MGEILDYHAKGEEAAVFPAVDNVAPLVAQSYLFDHRELDIMVNGLEAMRKALDPLTVARATAVLNSHLRIHLDKEDAYLYPILKERTTESEQSSIVSVMSQKVPSDKFPTLVKWLFPLLEFQDQVAVTKRLDDKDASAGFCEPQAINKKERSRELGRINSTNPGPIRQPNSAELPFLSMLAELYNRLLISIIIVI